jgi:hypothetical protein
MTTTTETAGTRAELAPVAPGILAMVEGGKPWTIATLADKLAPAAPVTPPTVPFPDPAPVVKFTPALRKALGALPKLVGNVNPTTRRLLEPTELAAVTDERNAINAVVKPLAKRLDAISEMVRHHQDLQAERDGIADPETSDRVGSGVAENHYMLAQPEVPFETPVEGYEDSWRQVYVAGRAYQSMEVLLELLEKGEITRQEFLAFTTATRVIDQNKAQVFIAKNPGRGLQILGAITRRGAAGASLYAPKRKIEE